MECSRKCIFSFGYARKKIIVKQSSVKCILQRRIQLKEKEIRLCKKEMGTALYEMALRRVVRSILTQLVTNQLVPVQPECSREKGHRTFMRHESMQSNGVSLDYVPFTKKVRDQRGERRGCGICQRKGQQLRTKHELNV